MLLMNFWRVLCLNRDQIVLTHVGFIGRRRRRRRSMQNVIERANWHDNFPCANCTKYEFKSWKRSFCRSNRAMNAMNM